MVEPGMYIATSRCQIWQHRIWYYGRFGDAESDTRTSVATAIAGVFANFTNKIGIITEKLDDVDKAKSQGVSCQH